MSTLEFQDSRTQATCKTVAGHLADIRELNLSYLLLCQRLLRDDLSSGLYRTGLDQEVGILLRDLSLNQLQAMAGRSELLCAFRLNDAGLFDILSKSTYQSAVVRAQISLAMAQRTVVSSSNV